MPQTNELSTILKQSFDWNKARLDCLTGMIIGLIKTRSVSLNEIAMGFPSDAKPNSRYRRIQRFIHDYEVDFDTVAPFVMNLFGFTSGKNYLALDRTNWKWGKKNINILMLAIVYKGTAIPIYWKLLDKQGNSNTDERIVLLKRFILQFGKDNIKGILADREFIGSKWLKWLDKERITFYIRIKKDAKVPSSKGKETQVHRLFRYLKVGESTFIKRKRMMTGLPIYLSVLRLQDGELLIIASNKFCENAIEIYGKRWEIETLFSCLKGRGFNLEDTHMTDQKRIKRLLIVPVIAFCWAHLTGEWQHSNVKEIKTKNHKRLAKSFFRYGLDLLRDKLLGSPIKIFYECFLQFIDFNSKCYCE